MTSCKTSNLINETLPDIYFPTFPISTQDPNISFITEDNCVVIKWGLEQYTARIPINIWESFVTYAIEVNTAEKKYKAIQGSYVLPHSD